MLDAEYLRNVSNDVVKVYSQLETDISLDIARRVVKNGGAMTVTSQYQLEKAIEFGYIEKDVNKYIATATKVGDAEILKAMSSAANEMFADGDVIYKAAGLTPIALKDSPALQAMVLQGADDTKKLVGNLTKTTGTVAKIAYNNVLDQAYMQTISGAFDQNTAIRNAVKTLATKNIYQIAYPSGRYQDVESSVRRAVTTGINQSIGKLQLERCEEMDCELVETSSHAGARPEHAEWQGMVFCIKGTHPQYGDFYNETGYGTGEGLCGWNCYHTFYPYYEGLSTQSFEHDPSAEDDRINNLDYQVQQEQRAMERKVRDARKECVVYEAAYEAAKGDDELQNEIYKSFTTASIKLKERETNLNKFERYNKGVVQNSSSRLYTAGYDRNVSTMASNAVKNANK